MFGRWLFGLASMLFVFVACGTAVSPPTNGAVSTPIDASDVAQPSTSPTIVGEITQLNRRMLVEQPGATIGDKIDFSLNNATRVVRRTGDQLEPKNVGDLAVGQRVEVWDAGVVLESFPAQAEASTIVIVEGGAPPLPNEVVLPAGEPSVVGRITQASNTVIVNDSVVLLITPTTQFLRKTGDVVEVIDAQEIVQGQRVEAWTTELRYGGTPRADVLVLVVIED